MQKQLFFCSGHVVNFPGSPHSKLPSVIPAGFRRASSAARHSASHPATPMEMPQPSQRCHHCCTRDSSGNAAAFVSKPSISWQRGARVPVRFLRCTGAAAPGQQRLRFCRRKAFLCLLIQRTVSGICFRKISCCGRKNCGKVLHNHTSVSIGFVQRRLKPTGRLVRHCF